MIDFRSEAKDKLNTIGLPHRRMEAWKYSIIDKYLELKKDGATPSLFNTSFNFKASILKFTNGRLESNNSDIQIECLENYNLLKIEENNDPMTLFNQANLEYHYKVVFKNTLKDPVIFIFDNSKNMNSISLEFNVEKEASVDLLEYYHANTDSTVSVLKKINLEENSKLNLTTLTKSKSENNFLHLHTTVDQKKGSEFHDIKIITQNEMTRNEIIANLNEPLAHAEVSGLYALKNSEKSDTKSTIIHHAPHTTSEQLYKGVMDDESKGIFLGLVKVGKNAQLVNSTQVNRNLLLTKKAQAYSRPQLEIFADDVKCSHGSTTGQLSESELFYFISRGIKPERARALLSMAYTTDIILKIKNQDIRNFILNDFLQNDSLNGK